MNPAASKLTNPFPCKIRNKWRMCINNYRLTMHSPINICVSDINKNMARGGRSYGGECGSAGGARFREDYTDYRLFDDELGAQPMNQLFSLFHDDSIAYSDNVPLSSIDGEAGGASPFPTNSNDATNKKEHGMWSAFMQCFEFLNIFSR